MGSLPETGLDSALPVKSEERKQLGALSRLQVLLVTEAHEIGEKRKEELGARILDFQVQAVTGELEGNALLVEASRSTDMARGTARLPLFGELRRRARILRLTV